MFKKSRCQLLLNQTNLHTHSRQFSICHLCCERFSLGVLDNFSYMLLKSIHFKPVTVRPMGFLSYLVHFSSGCINTCILSLCFQSVLSTPHFHLLGLNLPESVAFQRWSFPVATQSPFSTKPEPSSLLFPHTRWQRSANLLRFPWNGGFCGWHKQDTSENDQPSLCDAACVAIWKGKATNLYNSVILLGMPIEANNSFDY